MIDFHLNGTGTLPSLPFLLFISLFLLYIIYFIIFYSLLFFIILLGMDPKCLLTSTDLQTRRAHCQHQLSFLLVSQLCFIVLVQFLYSCMKVILVDTKNYICHFVPYTVRLRWFRRGIDAKFNIGTRWHCNWPSEPVKCTVRQAHPVRS